MFNEIRMLVLVAIYVKVAFFHVTFLTMATGEVPQAYVWSEEDKKLIQQHRMYIEMQAMLTGLEQHGPDSVNLPKKPQPDIKKLFKKSQPKPLLSGHDLHNYLWRRIFLI